MAGYIPIVDFSPLSEKEGRVPTEADWVQVSKEVYNALNKVGFVYLINHGIPEEKIQDAFQESRNFFELPTEVKRKYLKNREIGYHGYAEPGQEILDPSAKMELRESYDFLRSASKKHYLCPDSDVPKFQDSLNDLEKACQPLIRKLLITFARALDLCYYEFFINASKNLDDPSIPSYTTFRALYYPPIGPDDNIQPGTVRCAQHTDYGTLTLLFQDEIGGLEVKTVEDTWVPATPILGSCLVNTGDLLEFWSGGRFPATFHRVLIPEIELRKRIPRQSIVYFVHPDDEVLVQPLGAPSDGTSSQSEPVTAYEHAKRKLESSYQY